MELRFAKAEDAPALEGLIDQLGYDASARDAGAYVRRAATSPEVAIVVAESDGRVVAWMELAERRALESGAWAEITGLVVDERMRGRGIGAALVGYAREWARGRGLARLRVRTNEKRADTHRFYEREGFELVKLQRVYEVECGGDASP